MSISTGLPVPADQTAWIVCCGHVIRLAGVRDEPAPVGALARGCF
jgi:hypothetical protein